MTNRKKQDSWCMEIAKKRSASRNKGRKKDGKSLST
jgi:hypothetical protein